MTGADSKRYLDLTFALGALGAATLVLGNRLVGSGKYVVILYFVVVVGAILVTRSERIASFRSRLTVIAGTFVISSIALYVSLLVGPIGAAISVSGHAWRVGVALLVGIAVGLPAARIAAPPNRI